MLGVFLCLRELVRSSGVATILLFQKTSQRFYYLGLVETMSLLMKRKKAAAASDAFNVERHQEYLQKYIDGYQVKLVSDTS